LLLEYVITFIGVKAEILDCSIVYNFDINKSLQPFWLVVSGCNHPTYPYFKNKESLGFRCSEFGCLLVHQA
jgi:hypothetical protein